VLSSLLVEDGWFLLGANCLQSLKTDLKTEWRRTGAFEDILKTKRRRAGNSRIRDEFIELERSEHCDWLK
jgi:hypothetical protein